MCAADLAGAEAQYPMTEFMELFEQTKKLGMPFTIHAGECGNAQNIVDAIEAGAKESDMVLRCEVMKRYKIGKRAPYWS